MVEPEFFLQPAGYASLGPYSGIFFSFCRAPSGKERFCPMPCRPFCAGRRAGAGRFSADIGRPAAESAGTAAASASAVQHGGELRHVSQGLVFMEHKRHSGACPAGIGMVFLMMQHAFVRKQKYFFLFYVSPAVAGMKNMLISCLSNIDIAGG